jgi:hypothetical protein
VREIIALWIFLTEILPALTRQSSILWRIDNTAALAHIRKEGGLKGRDLLEEAVRILLLLHQHQLRILPAFIPSEENVQADAASLDAGFADSRHVLIGFKSSAVLKHLLDAIFISG